MNNPQTMQLNEKLEWICAANTLDERVARAKTLDSVDGTFASYMKMATVERERIQGLPEGMPDSYKPERDMPDGVADTTARQELRRLKNFKEGGDLLSLPRAHREQIWLNTLQGVHWKEAEVLIMIKEQTLFTAYPQLQEVLVTLGVPVTAQAPKTAAKKAPKTKK